MVRYSDDGRTVTVVGSADFMTNAGLLKEGNAALAMNLAGARPRVVWYAPQRIEGESDSAAASILGPHPGAGDWIVLQLCLVVLLVALWKGRRVGPLVAERPAGRGARVRDGRGPWPPVPVPARTGPRRRRAAHGHAAAHAAAARPWRAVGSPLRSSQSVAHRVGGDPATIEHWLYGPPPATDDELVELSRQLDHLERQVAHLMNDDPQRSGRRAKGVAGTCAPRSPRPSSGRTPSSAGW